MIRNLETKDIDKIMKIWLNSTIKGHKFIPKEYWEKNYDVVKNEYIPMAETFVFEEEEKIKGFISIINNEFIGALFVDVDYQNRGVGKALIEFAVEKYKHLTVQAYKDNKKAVEFYLNRGFKIIEEENNEDSGYREYVMSL